MSTKDAMPEHLERQMMALVAAAKNDGYCKAIIDALSIVIDECDPSKASRIGKRFQSLASESAAQFRDSVRISEPTP